MPDECRQIGGSEILRPGYAGGGRYGGACGGFQALEGSIRLAAAVLEW